MILLRLTDQVKNTDGLIWYLLQLFPSLQGGITWSHFHFLYLCWRPGLATAKICQGHQYSALTNSHLSKVWLNYSAPVFFVGNKGLCLAPYSKNFSLNRTLRYWKWSSAESTQNTKRTKKRNFFQRHSCWALTFQLETCFKNMVILASEFSYANR